MLDRDESVSRRRFLNRISIGLSALGAGILSVPILAYLLSPLINPTRQQWVALGPASQFKLNDTIEVSYSDPSPVSWAGQTANTAVWVRRSSETSFTVFAVNCTHLGCPVNWRSEANLFLCPCHGGVYYADGQVAGGPPPRALFQYQSRVQNGNLEIETRSLPVAG